jgi:sugar lactone lactonase YvrE
VNESPPRIAVDAHADCGESPAWDARLGQLVWVDQFPGLVHWYDPATGGRTSLQVGQPVGSVAPRRLGGLVLALADGFWILEPDLVTLVKKASVEAEVPDNMMNDGKCDQFGRFWAGTLAIDEQDPVGSLYRLDPNGDVIKVLSQITISNGLGWSPDGRTLYYIDSRTQRVDAFSFDPDTGRVVDRRVVVAIPTHEGTPDGLTIDAEGHVWVALWGGSAVRRYSPNGHLEHEVRFPVSRITSCVFGGNDLADLYVTSASRGLTPSELRSQPHAGAVFVVRPGVRGLPTDTFAG